MRIAILFAAALVLLCQPSYSAETSVTNSKAWVIYVAMGADTAYQNVKPDNKDLIKQYEYPLYVGYFYSTDGKSVQWKCFVPMAQAMMKNWAEYQNKVGGQVMLDRELPYPKNNKLISTFRDPEYRELIGWDIRRRGMREIHTVLGEKPDDAWRPQFKHQYRIEFSVDVKDHHNFFNLLHRLEEITKRKEDWELWNGKSGTPDVIIGPKRP